MTNHELILKLAEFPPDIEVRVDSMWNDVAPIALIDSSDNLYRFQDGERENRPVYPVAFVVIKA